MPVAVVVWSKPDCRQCTATKRALHKHGISFIERDLTEHTEQATRFRDAGYATAPIVVTSRGTWAGYQPDLIKKLKEHA